MYCQKCGAYLDEGAKFCTQCGTTIGGGAEPRQEYSQQVVQAPVQYQPQAPSSSTYLVFAILATILCCWPLGIPAIVYAAKISGLVRDGMIAEAHKAASRSMLFSILSAVVGVLLLLVFFFVFMIGLFAELASY